VKSPQTHGIVERFHKTLLNEFYRIVFRKKIYPSLEDLQADLELGLREDNEERAHQGRWCSGKTPRPTLLETIPRAKEKGLAAEGRTGKGNLTARTKITGCQIKY
jgi:hypothetical protein